MFGSHLSISGGMVKALHEASKLELDCVQVFTKNQRQWKAAPLAAAERDAWLNGLLERKWRSTDQKGRTVSHNSYLINLASPDPDVWEKSIALERIEMERCEALDIPLLVSHPGAHLGAPRTRQDANRLDGTFNADERAGLERIVLALDRLAADLPGAKVITCLETTVGAGTTLGYDFAHLRFVRERLKYPETVGFCLDTCHVTAAGYDMTTPANATAVLDQWDAVCGLEHLHVIHVNDSQGEVGSRKDRHAHIGHGTCGEACFRAILNHPRLKAVPKILETPKGENDAGDSYDAINVRTLKGLMNSPGKADMASSPASGSRLRP